MKGDRDLHATLHKDVLKPVTLEVLFNGALATLCLTNFTKYSLISMEMVLLCAISRRNEIAHMTSGLSC